MRETQTINDHFEKTISGYPLATNFVLVLDPDGFLDLNEEYIDLENDKTWKVLKYFGNDLAFRKEYFANKTGDKALLLLVIKPLGQQTQVDLGYVYDIVEKIERIVDLSLQNVIQELIPRVTWPEALFKHSKEIGMNLRKFHSLYVELSKELPPKVPLSENHMNAILIALRNPNVQLPELILNSLPTEQGIIKYSKIILSSELNEEDRQILINTIEKNIIEDSAEISPWFKLKRDELATFFYLLDVASRYKIPNPLVQLKGLGLISFDPDDLGENIITKVTKSIQSNYSIKSQVKKIAEETLTLQDALKIIQCTKLTEPTEIVDAFRSETNPLIAYALAVTFLKEITKKTELKYANIRWADELAKQKTILEETETAFSEKADKILRFLANITAALYALEIPFEKKIDLAALIDWWNESDFYKIQIVITDAANYCQTDCEVDGLKKVLRQYIHGLKQKLNEKIEQADQNLSIIIEKNWKGYLDHPRLSANILKEYITLRNLKPSKDRKIWVLIFDGMRLDTWKQIVKPILQTKFEIKEEKLFLSTIPSKTDIARVAVLAGKPPNQWEDYYGRYTSDHNILASRLFGLSQYEGRDKLKVTVNADADFARERLDTETTLYNILIYNLSDDWIHNFQDNLRELNKIIEEKINRIILPDLENRVGEKDIIVLTSDHGFIELEKTDEQKVFQTGGNTYTYGTTKQGITYRVLENIEHPKGYRISYLPHTFFTAAIGRKWFMRPGGRFARYAHGGISLDETVVPGVLMEKIVFSRLDLKIECSNSIELTEDVPSTFQIKIINQGNRTTDYQITFRLNTGESKEHLQSIPPKEEQKVSFQFEKPTLLMRNLEITLSYRTLNKEPLKPKKRVIPIIVRERKDKVEFKFGGLDKIME